MILDNIENIEDGIDRCKRSVDNLFLRMSNLVAHITKSENKDKLFFLIEKDAETKLTASGRCLLKESSGLLFLEQNQSLLVDQIRSFGPQCKYDVEEFAYAALLKNKRKVKDFRQLDIYVQRIQGRFMIKDKTPVVWVDINVDLIIYIMSFYLRDKYIEEYYA